MVSSKPVSTARSRLRLRFAASVAAGGLGLAALWRPLGAAWVLAALPVGGYLAAYAAVNLAANRPSEGAAAEAAEPQAAVDADVFGRLGPANVVTLFRGWLVAVLAGALVADPPAPWLPVWLFAGAAGLDAVDGAVARRTRETVLGGRLDAATDALAVLVGAAVAVALGGLPGWYLLAGGVWYAYAAALWRRRRAGRPVYRLPPSRLRPVVGTAQFLVVGAGLLPAAGDAGWLVALAALALAALLASFARDWAAATGRLGRTDPPTAPRSETD